MPQTPTLTPEIVEAAIEGLEARKQRIDEQIAELRAMMPTEPSAARSQTTPQARRGRRMSAAGRAAIAEAQRRRWAATKGQASSAPPAQKAGSRKRRLSAAGRKAISEAAKKRWAAKKAASAKE